MNKIKTGLKGLIWSLLLVSTLPLWAYQAPQYVLYMPKGFGPEQGHTEFGVMGEGVYRDKDAIQQVGGFFNIALTNHFRYGLEVDSDSRVFHHVHATIFSSKIPDREEHNFALGFSNAAWQPIAGLPPKNSVIGMFGVYTISFNDRDFNFHLGAAGDQYQKESLLTLFGVDKQTPFGRLSMEWDGGDFNIGLKTPVTKQLNTFIVYSPTAGSEPDAISRFLRFGLTFTDQFIKIADPKTSAAPAMPMGETPTFEELAQEDVFEDIVVEEQPKKFPKDEFTDEVVEEEIPKSRKPTDKKKFEPEEAETSLEMQDRALTKAAMSHLQKGLEYYYAGKLQASAHEYHMVVSLMPKLPVGYMRLGSIYYRIGDMGKAKKYWEMALSLDPENQEIIQALRVLEQPEPMSE